MSSTDMKEYCKYYADTMACYPSCLCNDESVKATLDANMKAMKDMGCDEVKCGAAGTLQASLLFGLVAVAAAFKNSF